MKTLPVEILRQILDYYPETGKMFWQKRPIELFARERDFKSWNTQHAGEEAFTTLGHNGYLYGEIFDVPHLAHRVCWALFYGEWPSNVLDHDNRVRTDNKIQNLVLSEPLKNQKNQSLFKTNTSGTCGVRQRGNRWIAEIKINSQKIHLGSFVHRDDCIKARKAAETQYGFHPGHGASA